MSIFSALFSSPKDISQLLMEFCARCLEGGKSPSLQHFWKSIKESDTTKAVVVIRIFGRLQEERVVRCLDSSKKNIYQITSQALANDCAIILKYNLTTIKLNQSILKPLPLSAPSYSWRVNEEYLSATNDFEYAKEKLTYFILSSEMPLEMAKALHLHTVKFLRPALEAHQRNLNETVQNVYRILKQETGMHSNSLLSINDKSFISLQQMLLRHAAFVGDAKFISWMDEIAEWSLGRSECAKKFISHFNVCHLVGISIKDILSKVVPPPIIRVYSLSRFKFNDSFQHYLIRKTLDQIISYYSISGASYDELASVFEKSDEDRRFVCFYWHFIKELFQKTENKNLLIQLVHLTKGKEHSLFDTALNVLYENIDNTASQTLALLISLTCTYYLDYLSHFKLPANEKKIVFDWIHSRFSTSQMTENDLQFFHLSKHLLAFIPFDFHLKLRDLFIRHPDVQDNIVKCLINLFSLYEDQVTEASTLFERGHSRVRLSISIATNPDVYQTLNLLLYFIHFKVFFSEPLFKFIPLTFLINVSIKNIDVQKSFMECMSCMFSLYTNQKTYDPDLFEKGLDFLDKKISKDKYPDVHQTLHLFLFFIHFMYHLKLNEEGQRILIDHLLNSTQEERDACIQDLKSYVKDLKIKWDQTIEEARLNYFQEVFKQALLSANDKDLIQNILDSWPEGFDRFDIHLESIRLIEEFCQAKLPLICVVNMLLYPIFSPKLLKRLNDLPALREKIYSEEIISTFFIPPALADERDKCVGEIISSGIFPSHTFQGNHRPILLQRMTDIVQFLQATLLPEPIHIKHLAKQSLMLFSSDKEGPLAAELLKLQNSLSSFASTPNSPLFLQSWNETSDGYPELELTFLRTAGHPESRRLKCRLEIPLKTLHQEPSLWSALHVMIKQLGRDTREKALEDKLKQHSSESEEFDLYLQCFPLLNKAWTQYCLDTKLNKANEIGLAILRFIKNVKINSRKILAGLAGFFEPDQNYPTHVFTQLAAQGNIYFLEDGLSLLPPSLVARDIPDVFQLKNGDLHKEISDLCKTIRRKISAESLQLFEKLYSTEELSQVMQLSQQISRLTEKITIDNFGVIRIGWDKYSVTATFDPLFIAHPFKRKQWGFYNEVALILNDPKGCTYSVKYRQMIQKAEFEIMLRWQLLMLKSAFFEKQFSQ